MYRVSSIMYRIPNLIDKGTLAKLVMDSITIVRNKVSKTEDTHNDSLPMTHDVSMSFDDSSGNYSTFKEKLETDQTTNRPNSDIYSSVIIE